MAIKVVVWNEFRHEKDENHKASQVYPEGMHKVIGDFLKTEGYETRFALLDEQQHGLTDELLNSTDVLIWWGHMAHHEVSDEVVEKVYNRVQFGGMGLIVLHSGHFSKIFKKLMGTSCNLKWRESDEPERVWVVNASHPITTGIPEYFDIPVTEMYGERFDIPQPDDLIFISWHKGGEVFRSGCCWSRGRGKIFYFSPGHESNPIYYQDEVRKVISNAVKWAAPCGTETTFDNFFDRIDEK